MKIIHLVSAAIEKKYKQLREEALIRKMNRAFEDPEIQSEQLRLSDTIADNTDIGELPW